MVAKAFVFFCTRDAEGDPKSLLPKSISNTRKMRPLQNQYLDVHDRCMEPGKEKILNFHDGLL